MKFYICVFFEILSRKFKVPERLKRMAVTLLEDLCTFLIPRSILLRVEKATDKSIEKIKTHVLCTIIPPFPSLHHPPKKIMPFVM